MKTVLYRLSIITCLFLNIKTFSFAQAEGYLGEIRLFAGNAAPKNWMFCNGQTIPIASNQALYSVIGNAYGGNGSTSFQLPDLRGYTPVGVSSKVGFNDTIGTKKGKEILEISESQYPNDFFTTNVLAKPSVIKSYTKTLSPIDSVDFVAVKSTAPTAKTLTIVSTNYTKNSLRPSSLGLNYIICVTGLFPNVDERETFEHAATSEPAMSFPAPATPAKPTHTALAVTVGKPSTTAPTATTTATTNTTTSTVTTTTATTTSTIPTSGKKFNGTSDYVALPATVASSVSGGGAITIEYWFKGTNIQSAVRLQQGENYIVAGWGGSPAHIVSTDGGAGNGIAIKLKDGSSINDGKWHHVAMTWEKNKTNGFKSYVDGDLVAQRNSANVNLPTITTGSGLGAFVNNNVKSEFTNGEISRVRIWKVVRTEAQIKESKDKVANYATDANLIYQATTPQ